MPETRKEESIPSLHRPLSPAIDSAEPPLPGHSDEPPKGVFAMAVAILWGVLAFGFGFEAVVNFNDLLRPAGGTQDAIIAGVDLVLCVALGMLAMILWKARDWLPKRVADSAVAVSTNPSVWVAVALVILIISALPQLWLQPQKTSPTAEEIADAVVRALPAVPSPATSAADEQTAAALRSQLKEAQTQRDQATRERDAANQKLKETPAIPALPNPLHDPGAKYVIASGIRHAMINGDLRHGCNIILVHYPLPYAESFAEDTKELFATIGSGWNVDDRVATTTLPREVSLKSLENEPEKTCTRTLEQYFRATSLGGKAIRATIQKWLTYNEAPEYLKNCPENNCIELAIGNEQQ